MSLFGGVQIPGHPDLENCRKLDLLAIPFIRRAHRLGVAIEREHFYDLSSRFAKELITLEKDIASYIPADRVNEFSDRANDIENPEDNEDLTDISFNASSAEQIGKLLFDMLDIGGELELKKTKGGKRLSTGKKQLEMLKLQHPIVPLILRHREIKKLKTTYSDKLPEIALFHPRGNCCPVCELSHTTDQWRVHGEMGTTRAATGRINHKNPNLGNVPTRTDDGQDVQAGFIAPPGHVFILRDLSQIELCVLADISNSQSMIKVYQEGGDIHDDTARKIFKLADDVKPDKIKHRLPSKRVSFSIANGTTSTGLYMQLIMDYGASGIPVPDWLTEEWCGWLLQSWIQERPEVQEHFERQWYLARRYGLVFDKFGRVRLVPEVRSCHSWIRAAGLRQAQNMSMTSTAAGQLKLGMGKSDYFLRQLWNAGRWCWGLLTIHDCIMVEAAEECAEEVDEMLKLAMEGCMTDEETGEHRFRVPINSDGETVTRWIK